MMTQDEVLDILESVEFVADPNLILNVKFQGGDNYLQIIDTELEPDFNSGRKWRISLHMCRSELVQTAFAAYLAWVEHEARESFRYGGQAVFGPHLDVDVLRDLAARPGAYEYRRSY